MRLTFTIALLTLAGCAENSAIARAVRGGPPVSEAVALAAEQFPCDPATLIIERPGDDVRIRGCGQTAVYRPAGDVWEVRLRYRDAGWIIGKDYYPEDLAVFARAVDALRCAPHGVVLERHHGVRVAKGCGSESAHAVVCGEEVRELAPEERPTVGAWRPEGSAIPPAATPSPSERPARFGAGMTPPKRLCGRLPRYSELALEIGSKGLMIVRCVIRTDGVLSACDVIKGLDYHNEVALDALYSQRYTPVTVDGQPVAVDYVFNIRMR